MDESTPGPHSQHTVAAATLQGDVLRMGFEVEDDALFLRNYEDESVFCFERDKFPALYDFVAGNAASLARHQVTQPTNHG